jgi:hypothetical protein
MQLAQGLYLGNFSVVPVADPGQGNLVVGNGIVVGNVNTGAPFIAAASFCTLLGKILPNSESSTQPTLLSASAWHHLPWNVKQRLGRRRLLANYGGLRPPIASFV